MKRTLFVKTAYDFSRTLVPVTVCAAIAAYRFGYPTICCAILAAAAVFCIPALIIHNHQKRCRYADNTYGGCIGSVFAGKCQRRLRCRLVEYIHLLDNRKKYRKAADKLESAVQPAENR